MHNTMTSFTLAALAIAFTLTAGCIHAQANNAADVTHRLAMARLASIYKGGWTATGVGQLAEALHLNDLGGVNVYSKAYFDSKPLVAFVGQFSTGKTTIIQDVVLQAAYPGANIAPSPSTDMFTVIVDCGTRDECAQLPPRESGTAAAARKSGPFRVYAALGQEFLQRLEIVRVSHEVAPILKHISLLDSPGITGGDIGGATAEALGVQMGSGYDHVRAWQTITEHADVLIAVFDVKGGDLSVRYQRVLRHLAASDHKVTFLFNKADQMTPHQLTLTFGGLMWRLSRVFSQNEMERMYFGSFWNQPCDAKASSRQSCAVFEDSKRALQKRLSLLPLEVAMSRVGEFQIFLARLEVMAKLLQHLQRQVSHYNSIIFTCVNKDQQERDLDDPIVLRSHIADAIRLNQWQSPVLPDIDRFVRATLRNGGVCRLPSVPSGTAKALEAARAKIWELYEEVGRKPAQGFLERWGLRKRELTPSGHTFQGGVQQAREEAPTTTDDTGASEL